MTSEKYEQLIGVAKNSTSPTVLYELSRVTPPADSAIDIRVLVARNTSTSVRTLEFLSKNSSSLVRLAVARNPKTSNSVLVDLAKDPADEVRNAVLKNPSLPNDVKFEIFKKS